MVGVPGQGPQPSRRHGRLAAESPNAAPVYRRSTNQAEPKKSIGPLDIVQRWADVSMFNDRPLMRSLSGLSLEYRIVQIYSRDAGKREARISFNVGQGTQDLGFRARSTFFSPATRP